MQIQKEMLRSKPGVVKSLGPTLYQRFPPCSFRARFKQEGCGPRDEMVGVVTKSVYRHGGAGLHRTARRAPLFL